MAKEAECSSKSHIKEDNSNSKVKFIKQNKFDKHENAAKEDKGYFCIGWIGKQAILNQRSTRKFTN